MGRGKPKSNLLYTPQPPLRVAGAQARSELAQEQQAAAEELRDLLAQEPSDETNLQVVDLLLERGHLIKNSRYVQSVADLGFVWQTTDDPTLLEHFGAAVLQAWEYDRSHKAFQTMYQQTIDKRAEPLLIKGFEELRKDHNHKIFWEAVFPERGQTKTCLSLGKGKTLCGQSRDVPIYRNKIADHIGCNECKDILRTSPTEPPITRSTGTPEEIVHEYLYQYTTRSTAPTSPGILKEGVLSSMRYEVSYATKTQLGQILLLDEEHTPWQPAVMLDNKDATMDAFTWVDDNYPWDIE